VKNSTAFSNHEQKTADIGSACGLDIYSIFKFMVQINETASADPE